MMRGSERQSAKQWEDGRTLPAVALQFETEKGRLVSGNETAKWIPEENKASIRENLDVLTGRCNTFRTLVAGQLYSKHVLGTTSMSWQILCFRVSDPLTNTRLF